LRSLGIRVKRMLRHLWPVLLMAAFSCFLFGSDTSTNHPRSSSLDERELHVWTNVAHGSEFNAVPHVGGLTRCEDIQPPEALTTPNPLVMPVRDRSHVKVSFIIGTDGRVHSPLILESAGAVGDRSVLSAVRIWRFRPATCNGVPTEIEDKIEFSSR
jgi:TonB family protein